VLLTLLGVPVSSQSVPWQDLAKINGASTV